MTRQPDIDPVLGALWLLSRHDHGALSPGTYAALNLIRGKLPSSRPGTATKAPGRSVQRQSGGIASESMHRHPPDFHQRLFPNNKPLAHIQPRTAICADSHPYGVK